MASFAMIPLTAITTPKNAISMKSTLPPVNGFGEANGLIIPNSSATLRRHEIIGGRCNLAEPDIGYPEFNRSRLLKIVVGGCRYQKSQFAGLIPPEDDHGNRKSTRLNSS